MIVVETYEIDNFGKYTEKYNSITEFINELAELGQELSLQPLLSWDSDNGEGMFFIEDEMGGAVSMGLIEEKRNRVETTIDDVLNAIDY